MLEHSRGLSVYLNKYHRLMSKKNRPLYTNIRHSAMKNAAKYQLLRYRRTCSGVEESCEMYVKVGL